MFPLTLSVNLIIKNAKEMSATLTKLAALTDAEFAPLAAVLSGSTELAKVEVTNPPVIDMALEVVESKGPEPKLDPEPAPAETKDAEPSQGLPTTDYVRGEVLKFVAKLPGRGRDILASLLQSFGATSVTTLAAEHYPHFLTKLEEARKIEEAARGEA